MATYNTDLDLWQNFKASRENLACGGALLSIHDGMVGNGMVVLARFESTRAAEQILRSAGFSKKAPGQWQ